jgi:SAM-dependent methyltransferase
MELARYRPDSCVCINVLEHVEDDRAALCHMAATLTPGGDIVLLVPAFAALYGPIDRKLGHYRRYNRDSIREVAMAAGLRVRKLRYMNVTGFFGWWVNAHVFRRDAQSEKQIEFFDRWIVPVQSRLEALVPPLLGQSLLVVLTPR